MSVLSDEIKNRIREYYPRYPTRQAATLPALHVVNDHLRYVPPAAVVEIAELLELAPAEVQDTLSFYGFFKQDAPHGRTRAWVCRSISCALRGGEEFLEHLSRAAGIRPEDAQRTAELAVEAGLDAVHVSAYADPRSGIAFTDAPLPHEPGAYLALAAGIKRRVAVPVIAVGRITPERAETALADGMCDFVAMGRALLERGPVHITDALADPEYEMRDAQELLGFRTILGIPLLSEGAALGVLSIWRGEVKPFSDAEIHLVMTFADQAAVAIRLAHQLAETTASLERESAVAEVLASIDRVTRALRARGAEIRGE